MALYDLVCEPDSSFASFSSDEAEHLEIIERGFGDFLGLPGWRFNAFDWVVSETAWNSSLCPDPDASISFYLGLYCMACFPDPICSFFRVKVSTKRADAFDVYLTQGFGLDSVMPSVWFSKSFDDVLALVNEWRV